MGSRTAGTVDPHESHFLSGGFDSPKFVNDLANTCCSVVVAPPFENGFDVYSPADKTEARIQQVTFSTGSPYLYEPLCGSLIATLTQLGSVCETMSPTGTASS